MKAFCLWTITGWAMGLVLTATILIGPVAVVGGILFNLLLWYAALAVARKNP